MTHPPEQVELPVASSDSGLPTDLLRQSARRLAVAMGLCGGVFGIYLLLFLGPYRQYGMTWARVLALGVVLLSAGLILYLGRKARSQRCIEGIAIGYELVLVFSAAYMSYRNIWRYDYQRPVDTISWSCVVILLFPFLVPMRAQKALMAALLTASTDVASLFLAPEAVRGDHPVGPQSDLYSLGCVAYWMLTGRLVFDADTALKMALAHASEAPIPPSQIAEQPIDARLERLVLSCLAKDPVFRPSSAEELREGLLGLNLVRTWTERDAQEWWSTHMPQLSADAKT